MHKGFSVLFVVNELYVKLLEPVKCQLISVTKELINVLAVGVDEKAYRNNGDLRSSSMPKTISVIGGKLLVRMVAIVHPCGSNFN
ncbi:hypothetical protein GBA52_014612 [Prunus armeniaca]|nr:hypothetical protein GBA52_014612 [Prunus armeniaca]